MKEIGKCDVCGKKLYRFHVYDGRATWERPKGSSWKDYHLVMKRFCSKECSDKAFLKGEEELKKSLLSKDGEKFKRLKFLVKNNPVNLFMVIIYLASLMLFSYFLITYDPKTTSPILVVILVPIIIIFALMIISMIRRPWHILGPIGN